MLRIGFIDCYLDEWHANKYPEMIRRHSGGEMEVTLAWGMIDHPNRITNAEWSIKYGITLAGSMEEVIEKSDVLVVLSPDNPEMHEELSELPLKSGKRVYVDKTFATDRAAAERMFALADKHKTPCWSASALNFAEEYGKVDKSDIKTIQSTGMGSFDNYSVHQIEPIVLLMGVPAKRVMSVGSKEFPVIAAEFIDGRTAGFSLFDSAEFTMYIGHGGGKSEYVEVKSDVFGGFTKALVNFFETGEIPVSHDQTLSVMAIRAAGLQALETPFEWVAV